MNESVKTCSKCGETKPVSQFHKNLQTPDGLHRYCKTCRGTKTSVDERTPLTIRPELRIWADEYRRVATCVVCNKTAELPSDILTVDEARYHVLTNAPRCERHSDSSLRGNALLRARRWLEQSARKVETIDLYHDVTVTLKGLARTRRIRGATEWIRGEREALTEEMVEFIQDHCIERSVDPRKVDDLNDRMPTISAYKKEQLRTREYSIDYMDECRRELYVDDDDGFNSLIDEI